jgi:hypothetical protein
MIRRKSNIERVEKRLLAAFPTQTDGEREFALWLAAKQIHRIGESLDDDSLVDNFLFMMAEACLSARPGDHELSEIVNSKLSQLTASAELASSVSASMKYALYSAHQNTLSTVGGSGVPQWPWKNQEIPQHGAASNSPSDR